jgi:hypothetical protein
MTAAVTRKKKKRLYSQYQGLGPRKLKVKIHELGTVNKKATTIALLEEVVEVVWVMDDSDSNVMVYQRLSPAGNVLRISMQEFSNTGINSKPVRP